MCFSTLKLREMVNLKRFFFIVLIFQFVQCSINQTMSSTNECKYSIRPINELNPNLTSEVNLYLKKLDFQIKNEFLEIWVKTEGDHIIYSLTYGLNISDYLINFTNSVFLYENKILIFVNHGQVEDLKKFSMNSCQMENFIKDKFPYECEYRQNYNMWPMPTNIDNQLVYELIFNLNGELINKKFYYI